MEPTARLEVAADQHHRYAVEIRSGLLRELPEQLALRFPGARLALISDSGVAPLYAQPLLAALHARGQLASLHVVAAGEASKSVEQWQRLVGQLHAAGLDRRGVVVNVGGGVACDLGGMVAATYMRGIAYANVPTTLLAQHDAAIGGKVAVNAPWAKNFLGAFHQPRHVWIDPETLRTLDRRQLAAGLAESIKVAMIGEPELLSLLERDARHLLARDSVRLGEVVGRSAAKKIELLAGDPFEHDLRRPLNLGHTFGHALETELEYEGLLHGEAVAWGLVVALEIACARGLCPAADRDRIVALLARCELPPPVAAERLHAALGRLAAIRLVRGNRLHYVLPTSATSVTIDEVASDELQAAVAAAIAQPLLRPRASAAHAG
ncbi:MAG: 3-dehydroquinate synthase [Planctomycetes bacterium]|nr:3-dehydroquinate synthase [Planctomycetota bacterium]